MGFWYEKMTEMHATLEQQRNDEFKSSHKDVFWFLLSVFFP